MNKIVKILTLLSLLLVSPLLADTVQVGQKVTLVASADGNPTPTFQWKKNNVAISGATNTALIFETITLTDSGTYSVLATNSEGSAASNDLVLTVEAPPPAPVLPVFALQPISVNAVAGTTIELTSLANGTPSPVYQWTKNGLPIAGATNSTLSLTNVTTATNGAFTVIASNAAGSVTSNTSWIRIYVNPTIATQPVDVVAKINQLFSLTVVANPNTFPAPTFQWRKNGTNLVGATNTSLNLLAIKTDAGQYDVVVKNSQATVTSTKVTVTILYPPVFITQPKVAVTAFLGTPTTLNSLADGVPTSTYQWERNGVSIESATNPDLVLPNATPTTAATYAVIAKNSEGQIKSIDSVVTVSSSFPPVITTELPVNLAIFRNTDYTLKITATGSNLQIRWYRGSMLLTGINSDSLTIRKMQNRDIGDYRVVVLDTVSGLKDESVCRVSIK